jgi:uncharacterized protein YjbI with pentapeptide repeats
LRGGADEAARLAQNAYLLFLPLGTYIAIIIWSTTDVQLLKRSPVTLPLLNVPLPIVGFYFIVPWLLLLIYFNLLLHLTFLAQRLHRFNAVLDAFTDDAAREDQRERLFPFPFSMMLIGRPAPWYLRRLLDLTVWTTIIWLPLGLILWMQLRFLPYHHEWITWTHRVAVLVDLGLLWYLWPLIRIPDYPGASAAQTITQWWEERRAVQRNARTRRRRWRSWFGCLMFVPVVCWLGIVVLPEEGMEVLIASLVPQSLQHVDPNHASKAVFIPTYWLLETPGVLSHRNLRLQEQVLVDGEPSEKVKAALRSADETKRTQALEEVTGLTLTNRDLRGADFRKTDFPKGDLRGANLKGANLWEAKIFAGNFSVLELSQGESCVSPAQRLGEWGESLPREIGKFLRRFSCYTNLQGAFLLNAQLQGADLRGADLRGAFLGGADLQGASLGGALSRGARLQGADLQGTSLQGADLGNAQLQGADLGLAQLQGAYLGGARLEGAKLFRADLQGANLYRAHIGSANFTQANLTLSFLLSLSRSPLDAKTFEKLKKSLTYVISDEDRRAEVLERIGAAVNQPDQLQAAVPPDQVMCDNVDLFPGCLTSEKMTDYDHALALFLVELACTDTDGAIARSVANRYLFLRLLSPDLARAFAKSFTAKPEKDCPGRVGLSGKQKDSLRKLVAGEPLAP